MDELDIDLTHTYDNDSSDDDEYEDAEDGEEEEGEDDDLEEIDEDDEEGDDEPDISLSAVDLQRLLSTAGPLRDLLLQRISGGSLSRAARRNERVKVDESEVPNLAGRELMNMGDFGSGELDIRLKGPCVDPRYKKRLSRRLLEREMGRYAGQRSRLAAQLVVQSLIPDTQADSIIHYDSRAYSGQFSEDGNFFYSCAQDFKVRMYDTTNPYDWKYYKTVQYVSSGQWTITDASLSPDNKYLAYSSITSSVCLANTSPDIDDVTVLEFAGNRRMNPQAMSAHYGIWSIRFSGDGRELVAGANDGALYVMDIETRSPILKLASHNDDVNAVCYGDRMSPHILYSGSDDTTIKVWDRRSMANKREVGIFPGHLEGVTYVDSKGDGRYVVSNSKDQTMKLWDIRQMMDVTEFEKLPQKDFSTGFDYRTDTYDEDIPKKHPDDKSLMTYRGHSVHQTLIRCHFSPLASTGSRYLYTGSADGKVAIYNLDGTVAGIVNVLEATKHSRPIAQNLMARSYYRRWHSHREWRTCVRDVSWHPSAPVLAATSWNGYGYAVGTVSVHSWKPGSDVKDGEERPMAARYDPQMQMKAALYEEQNPAEVAASADEGEWW